MAALQFMKGLPQSPRMSCFIAKKAFLEEKTSLNPTQTLQTPLSSFSSAFIGRRKTSLFLLISPLCSDDTWENLAHFFPAFFETQRSERRGGGKRFPEPVREM